MLVMEQIDVDCQSPAQQNEFCTEAPSGLEDLICRLGWSLVLRLRAKGMLTAEDVADQLTAAVSDVEEIRGSAQLAEIRGCLKEMLVHLHERRDAAA